MPTPPAGPQSGPGHPVPGPAPPANTTRPLHAVQPTLGAISHPPESGGWWGVLRLRDFRLLWAGQAASQLADKFLMGALLVIVYQRSGHASAESALMIAYTLPSVVLSAPAGVYADRHDKRLLMAGCNALRGGLILLIPAIQLFPFLANRSWPLLLITLLFSSVGQVFAPAEAASIPLLVGRSQLTVANSLFMTTVIMTLVLGVPLAGLSIRVFGNLVPFYIAAGLLMLAAVAIARVHTRLSRAPQAADPAAPATSMVAELREGLAILGSSPVLRLALAELTISLVTVFTVFALGAPYLQNVLHRGAEDTYLVLVPATVGMIASALVLARMGARVSRARLLMVALAVAGGVLIALGVGPGLLARVHAVGAQVPLTLALAAVFGGSLGCLLIPAFTVLQESTTEASRGRIFGGIFAVINASVAVPLLLAGGLADAFGVAYVVAGLGALLLLAACATATLLGGAVAVLDGPASEH